MQPCTNNTYNIWRESTVKKSSRLHGHGTFRPTCEWSVAQLEQDGWASEALTEWSIGKATHHEEQVSRKAAMLS